MDNAEKNKRIRCIEKNWPFHVTLLEPHDGRGAILRKRDLSPDGLLLDIWEETRTQFKSHPFRVGVPTTDLSGHVFDNKLRDLSSAQVVFDRYLKKPLLPELSEGRRKKWEKFLREHSCL